MSTTYQSLPDYLTLDNILHVLAILLALNLLHVGYWTFTNAAGMGKAFGLPVKNANAEHWAYAFGARESGYGLAILMLAYMGDWRAVGVVLSTGVILAVFDVYVCTLYGEGGFGQAIKMRGAGIFLLAPSAWYMVTHSN